MYICIVGEGGGKMCLVCMVLDEYTRIDEPRAYFNQKQIIPQSVWRRQGFLSPPLSLVKSIKVPIQQF